MKRNGDDWVARVDAQIRASIARHGVHLIAVAELRMMHTIGLQARHLPELVLIGLPVEQGAKVLNAVAAWCLGNTDDVLTPGRTFVVPAYNSELTWRTAPVSAVWCRENMNKMYRFYPDRWRPGAAGCVLQLLWPDKHGNHPGPFSASPWQPLLADED